MKIQLFQSSKQFAWILFVFVFISCQNAQKEVESDLNSNLPSDQGMNKFSDHKIVDIHQWKDERNTQRLLTFLMEEKPKYQEEAALALISVGDSVAVPTMMGLFLSSNHNEEDGLQKKLALAIANSGMFLSQNKINQLFNASPSPAVREVLYEALGKCSAIPKQAISYGETEADQFGILTAYYEWAARKMFNKDFIPNTISILEKTQNEKVLLIGAAYLARLKRLENLNLSSYFTNLVNLFSMSQNPNYLQFLAQSMALVDDSKKEIFLLEQLKAQSDYRVKVSLLSSFAPTQNYEVIEEITSYLNHENYHVETAVSKFLWKNKTLAISNLNSIHVTKRKHWQAEIYRLKLMLESGNYRYEMMAKDALTAYLTSSENGYFKSELYQHLSDQISFLELFYTTFTHELDLNVQTNGLQALGNIITSDDFEKFYKNMDKASELYEDVVTHLIGSLHSNDGFRVYTGAFHLQNARLHPDEKKQILEDIIKIKDQWAIPQYFETRLELEKLELFCQDLPTDNVNLLNPENNPIDWDLVRSIPKGQCMEMQTNKGKIVIELAIENSPGTASYIYKLVKEGFYDGLRFHRVLSNFVIQGGDPFGNGTGATEYSLRSEHSFLNYEEGAVGIASAGKDTESCQLFITHNATPHLNRRYTIVGYVKEGMDVVHQVGIGDTIESIKILQ